MIHPILIYDNETRVMRNKIENKINVFERKILNIFFLDSSAKMECIYSKKVYERM